MARTTTTAGGGGGDRTDTRRRRGGENDSARDIGLQLDVQLNRRAGGTGSAYRSGDIVRGRVIVAASAASSDSTAAINGLDSKLGSMQPPAASAVDITSVRVRCYFEARTLYTPPFDTGGGGGGHASSSRSSSNGAGGDGKGLQTTRMGKLKEAAAVVSGLGHGASRPQVGHEWHRGGVQVKDLLTPLPDGQDGNQKDDGVRGDVAAASVAQPKASEAGPVRLAASTTWDQPFSFKLPREVTIDESSQDRFTSTSQMNKKVPSSSSSTIAADLPSWRSLPRPPPASMRDNPDGSIEWVVEVIVDFAVPSAGGDVGGRSAVDEKTPIGSSYKTPLSSSPSSSSASDALGRPRAIPGSRLVCRRVFPFLPSRDDWQGRRRDDDGQDTAAAAAFGHWCDRSQLPGAEALIKRPLDASSPPLLLCDRTIRLVSTGALSRSLGIIETSCRLPRRLVMSNVRPRGPEVRIPVQVRFIPPSRSRLFAASASSSSNIHVESLTATLTERTWVRGGQGTGLSATRGHQQSVTYTLPEPLTINLTGDVQAMTKDGIERNVDLGDLDLGPRGTKRFRGLLPTVCTPNIERWYELALHLAVNSGTRNGTVRYLVGQQEVLVEPEDEDEATALFEDVSGSGGRLMLEEEEDVLPAYEA